MKKIYSISFMVILFNSCDGGTSSNNNIHERTSSGENAKYMGSDDMQYEEDAEMSQKMYLCPMCQGNRQIQHYYSGELIDCPACQGAGKVSAETIQQLQDAAQMGEDLAKGVINGGGRSEEHTSELQSPQ